MADDGGPAVFYSLRFVVDADPAAVGAAAAQALLEGRPGDMDNAYWDPQEQHPPECDEFIRGLEGAPRPLSPWPIAPEWERFTGYKQPFHSILHTLHAQGTICSFGLRPLQDGDSVSASRFEPGAFVYGVKTGFGSHVRATDAPGDAGGEPGRRSFRVEVKTDTLAKYAELARKTADGPQDGPPGPATIDPFDRSVQPTRANQFTTILSSCHVRPIRTVGGTRAEVVREIHMDNLEAILEAAAAAYGAGAPDTARPTDARKPRLYTKKSPAEGFVWVMISMLEMETRAWLRCSRCPLVEVWQGVRRPHPVAVASAANTVMGYSLAVGNGAATAYELLEGPSYDLDGARQLADELPTHPMQIKEVTMVDDQPVEVTAFGQFTDGNVRVESFAALLDRACSRAGAGADIFRRFVDLGSGQGVAVLTAWALFPFRACVGYELVPERNVAARALARSCLAKGFPTSSRKPIPTFVEGDFVKDIDWSDASVTYCNGLTWPGTLVRQVALAACRLKRGALVLMMAQPFPSEPAVLESFDFRGDACMGHWADEAPEHVWVYQRR